MNKFSAFVIWSRIERSIAPRTSSAWKTEAYAPIETEGSPRSIRFMVLADTPA